MRLTTDQILGSMVSSMPRKTDRLGIVAGQYNVGCMRAVIGPEGILMTDCAQYRGRKRELSSMAGFSRHWQRNDKGTIVSGLCGGGISMVGHGAMLEAGHDSRNYKRFRRTMVLRLRVGIWHD